jgi:hypothetical protein
MSKKRICSVGTLVVDTLGMCNEEALSDLYSREADLTVGEQIQTALNNRHKE